MCAVGSTTTAFTGESGSATVETPVKSVQLAPALVVCQTCPGPPVKPITVTYAVLPVASDASIATAETGNWLGLMLLPPGPFSVSFIKVDVVPDTAMALVVTQIFPPIGVVRLFGPGPSVVT